MDSDYFNLDITPPFSSVFEDRSINTPSLQDRFSVPTPPDGPAGVKNDVSQPSLTMSNNTGKRSVNRPNQIHRCAEDFQRLRESSKPNLYSKKLWQRPNQINPLSQIPKNEAIENTVANHAKIFGVNNNDKKLLVLESRDIEEKFDMEIRRSNIYDRYSK